MNSHENAAVARDTRSRLARHLRPLAGFAATIAIGLTLAGCFNPFSPRVLGRGISTPPPNPNTASGVLRLLEWAYTNREYSVYRTLFTDDYRFVFAALDTSGNSYLQAPWSREDELAYAQNLFEGGDANQPAATNIALFLDKTFNEFADPREVKRDDFTHYRAIRTQVALNITDANGLQTNVSGKALFYLVRGDVAAIPADLGFGPDANRWYINRWEDQTFTPGGGLSNAVASGPAGSTALATVASAVGFRASPALGTAHRLVRRDASRSATARVALSRPGAATAAEALPSGNVSWGLVKRIYADPLP